MSEDSITQQGFELIFAFDEVVTVGGNKVGINMNELHVNLVRVPRRCNGIHVGFYGGEYWWCSVV